MGIPNGTQVTVRDAQMIWRNFEGRETVFKPAGNRSFNVVLDEKTAQQLSNDGWNVRTKEPRDEGDDYLHTLEVGVGYKVRPPRVVMITSNSRVNLGEETVGVLDWADIEKVDLIFHAYNWEVGGKGGVKAYLKTMFVTINEDELEAEYGINDVSTASLEDMGGQMMEEDPV